MIFLSCLLVGIVVFRFALLTAFKTLGSEIQAESKRSLGTIVFAVFFPLIVILTLSAFGIDMDAGWGNRTLHGLGGGWTVAILLESVLLRLPKRPSILGEAFLLIATVSVAGVANEVLECVLDTVLHLGVFSPDRTDTWYDLISNTAGGIVTYSCIRGTLPLRK